MATYAFLSGGGSTAKTSTVVTLATMLAQEGKVVRVIDLDYQQGSSMWLRGDDSGIGSGDILLNGTPVNRVTKTTEVDNLYLVPANKDLDKHEIWMAQEGVSPLPLRRALASAPEVDYTFIDCQGDVGPLAGAGALAADRLIVVVNPNLRKSARGLQKLHELIADVHNVTEDGALVNATLDIAAVIPTRVKRGNAGAVYDDALSAMQEVFGDNMTPPIREASVVGAAFENTVPLPDYAPSHGVMDDYRSVRATLADRGVL